MFLITQKRSSLSYFLLFNNTLSNFLSLSRYNEIDQTKNLGPVSKFVMKRFMNEDQRKEIALVDGSVGSDFKSKTFEELYHQTYSFGYQLREKFGIKKGDVVAIMSPNHINYFSVFHGIGLCGASTTPVNPLYTADELHHQLEITKAKLIIFHPSCLGIIKSIKNPIPFLSIGGGVEVIPGVETIDSMMLEPMENINEDSFLRAEDFDQNSVMTLPFSSGTTGKAKGVMLTHRNLTFNILQTMAYEGMFLLPEHSKSKKRGVLLCPLPAFHIYGLMVSLCVPLYAGAKTIFMSQFDLKRYLEIIQEHKVTRGHVVPPIVLALAKHPIVDAYDLSSLECLMSGAAPLGGDVQVGKIKIHPLFIPMILLSLLINLTKCQQI